MDRIKVDYSEDGWEQPPRSRGYGNLENRYAVMRRNLIRMMGLDPDSDLSGRCVSEFEWSAEVKDHFYTHPYHKPVVSAMKRQGGLLWGMWCLQVEPCDVEGSADADTHSR